MFYISGDTITLTRGDTLKARIQVSYDNGREYIPREGDKIRFAMKKDYKDTQVLIEKDVNTETMELVLHPEDTKSLDFGSYVYDLQLTTEDDEVYTFIDRAKLKLTEEVD